MPKNAENYYCETCNFKCSKLSNYNKHLATAKHKKSTLSTKLKMHSCVCGKSYKERTGLWKHKKKCPFITEDLEYEEEKDEKEEKKEDEEEESKQPISTEMFFQLMKQNQDLQNLLIEQQKYQSEQQKQQAEQQKEHIELQKTVQEMIPKIGNITNTNCNNTNNTFNVQLFLNEQCKDALNLTEFLRSLRVGLDDVMKIGELGYSEGLSRIMVDGLKNLSITERPIHCTDTKREVIYVKDDNIWEKEKEGNPKLQKSIKYLANKNEYIMKTEWAKQHPHWEEDDTNDNREYHRLAMNMLGGTDDQETLNKKIYKNILPEVKLDKTKVV